jgi:hypothetical protein
MNTVNRFLASLGMTVWVWYYRNEVRFVSRSRETSRTSFPSLKKPNCHSEWSEAK